MSSETMLERYMPHLFFAGAALYGVFVVSEILVTYQGTAIPKAMLFASAATVLIPLGLVGLHRSLVTERPWLSRIAAVLVVIAAICWSIIIVGDGILEPAGILTEPPGPLALTPLVGLATLYLGYVLFGAAVLLADRHPWRLGVLLVIPGISVPLVMLVLTGIPTYVPNVVNLFAYAAIGWVLFNAAVPARSVGSPAETAT